MNVFNIFPKYNATDWNGKLFARIIFAFIRRHLIHIAYC